MSKMIAGVKACVNQTRHLTPALSPNSVGGEGELTTAVWKFPPLLKIGVRACLIKIFSNSPQFCKV
jgi:hypothetical protein